jgi:hypothetical protein
VMKKASIWRMTSMNRSKLTGFGDIGVGALAVAAHDVLLRLGSGEYSSTT